MISFPDRHGQAPCFRGWEWSLMWQVPGWLVRFGREAMAVTGDRPGRLLEVLGFAIPSGMSWGLGLGDCFPPIHL